MYIFSIVGFTGLVVTKELTCKEELHNKIKNAQCSTGLNTGIPVKINGN